MGWTCSVDVEELIRVQGFSEETGGKEPLARPKRRWVDNIMKDLEEV